MKSHQLAQVYKHHSLFVVILMFHVVSIPKISTVRYLEVAREHANELYELLRLPMM